MHITVQRENLLGAATRAASFTSRKTSIPILSYALLTVTEQATFTATDMERQIVEPFDVEVHEAGTATLPINQVLDIVKKLPKGSMIDIRHSEQELTIKSGRYITRMATQPIDDYPVFSDFTPTIRMDIPADVLRSRLEAVMFAISNEEVRYYLNGVYVHTDGEKLKFVATDGHRLAVTRIVSADVEGDLAEGIIIPRQTVSDIVKLLDDGANVEVWASDSRIGFRVGGAVITSKLIEGKFPEYQRVIPSYQDAVVMQVPASALSGLVERVAAVSSERSRPVKFCMSGEELSVSCTDPNGNRAEDVISASVTGSALDIGFQAKYVQDVMAQISAESVWKFGDSGSPAVVTDSGNGDFLAVIMPLRV